jgi:hypothetical protein
VLLLLGSGKVLIKGRSINVWYLSQCHLEMICALALTANSNTTSFDCKIGI